MASREKPAVGVVGLGIMGGLMAETLLAAGWQVCGYDPLAAARRRLARAGGRALRSVAEVAREADILILSLPSSAALEQVANGIASSGRGRGLVVIEAGTLPLADKLAAARIVEGAGHAMLDCPITGTASRMADRAWTIFVSGKAAAVRRALPVLRVFTDDLPQVGAFGHGTRLKYVANHLVAIYNVAYAEALTLSRALGLEPGQVLGILGKSPLIGNGVMRARGAMMVKRHYAPATMKVGVWQKDMRVIGEAARAADCPTPLFDTCASLYTAAMAQGRATEDTASVAEVLGVLAGRTARRPARSR